jgi:hypothetical protein
MSGSEGIARVWAPLLGFLAERLGSGAPTELTVNGNAITPTGGAHSVDTEAAAPTDTLAHIDQANLNEGSLLALWGADPARVVTVQHAAGGLGQIVLRDGANLDLVTGVTLLLLRQGTDWVEVVPGRRAANADLSNATVVPQAEAEAGTSDTPYAWTPERVGQAVAALTPDAAVDGLFHKADWEAVAFTKTGAGTAEIKAGTKVEVAGTIVEFSSATAITMPTLTAGTDYAIWVKDDGSIRADASFTAAPGAGSWRKIGGFHYDGEPKIKARSFWDLKFRPAATDPRGMVLNLNETSWVDCYPCNTDPDTNGTSKYGATIADDASPPKIPTKFGGDGTTNYGSFTWYEANEVMVAQGKQLLSQGESCVARYGSAEASSIGSDPVTTQYIAARESDCGMDMATGCMWEWGLGDGSSGSGSSWSASTEGRGSYYLEPNKPRFGGYWDGGSYSGSRCAVWSHAPSDSSSSIGARGRSDHVCHV